MLLDKHSFQGCLIFFRLALPGLDNLKDYWISK